MTESFGTAIHPGVSAGTAVQNTPFPMKPFAHEHLEAIHTDKPLLHSADGEQDSTIGRSGLASASDDVGRAAEVVTSVVGRAVGKMLGESEVIEDGILVGSDDGDSVGVRTAVKLSSPYVRMRSIKWTTPCATRVECSTVATGSRLDSPQIWTTGESKLESPFLSTPA